MADQKLEHKERCFQALYKDAYKGYEIQSAEKKSDTHYVIESVLKGEVEHTNVRSISGKWVVSRK